MSDALKYTVGWISALPVEFVAAKALLDEVHDAPSVARHDNNSYAFGKISDHYLVIAVLPYGEYGTTTAATVARDMLHNFPNVRIGLMVGIGGGVPSSKHDIRLGDVVVSSRAGNSGGVFPYDHGKFVQNKDVSFQHTGFLDQPPVALRAAVGALKSEYMMKGHQINADVESVLRKWPRLRVTHSRPPPESDSLYQSHVIHPDSLEGCEFVCSKDPISLVSRKRRGKHQDDPEIHYGLIASSNQLMKDARIRDTLAAKGVLCFEMEAAGLMNHFPCLVVRGICDYSDSHKNEEWQGFAAMTAAVYTKDLLRQIPPSKVETEERISDALSAVQRELGDLHRTVDSTSAFIVSREHGNRLVEFDRWLSPPDPSTNANHARKLRHKGTGTWILEDDAFRAWSSGAKRHLWLKGLAGCGKTVLTTTILDYFIDNSSVLSFFFDFSDTNKQTLDSMLRSFLSQLYFETASSTECLLKVFQEHKAGKLQPTTSTLSEVLCQMLSAKDRTIIIIDALDETTTRGELLTWVEDMVSSPQLHHIQILCTSRPEAEFMGRLSSLFGPQCCLDIDTQAVDVDIGSYVSERIHSGADFIGKALPPELSKLIQDKIRDKANGMFRLAACQLDTLARCTNPKEMKSDLKQLPRTLTETYDRMLNNIPEKLKKRSIRLLQFLLYTERPLMLSEAKEIIATDVEKVPRRFEIDARVFSDIDLLQYCPSLVSIVDVEFYDGSRKELHLAHFSVKEYLLRHHSFNKMQSSIAMTMTCLTYLRDIEDIWDDMRHRFPMARYAAEFWTGYAISAGAAEEVVETTLAFLQDKTTFRRWGRLYQADKELVDDPGNPEASRLYYACLCGLVHVAQKLLEQGSNVNAQGGEYGNPLQAASSGGHEEAVRLLIAHGADVNAWGGNYQTALFSAAVEGHTAVVKVLVGNGAKVNQQTSDGDTCLYAAAEQGRREIVQLLLENGADVNADGGEYGNALQAALAGGQQQTLDLLLDEGAKLDHRSPKLVKAIEAALQGGHREIVHLLLLDTIADGNAQSKAVDNILCLAASAGNKEVVQLLLGQGADLNAYDAGLGSPLQAASSSGQLDIVKLLLSKGAKDQRANALHAAVTRGYDDIVEELLDNGADVDAEGGVHGNALQTALYEGHQSTATLLLDRNVNANAQGRLCGTPLQTACWKGYLIVVRLLLEKGARVNDLGGMYGNALYAASFRGHEDIAKLLLDNSADVDAEGGVHGRALQAAAFECHLGIVDYLVDHGADVNAIGGYFGSALQAACYRGHRGIVEILLRNGANVHLEGGEYGNSISAASAGGRDEIVQLLLDNGATLSTQVPNSNDPNNINGAQIDQETSAAETGYKTINQLPHEEEANLNEQGSQDDRVLHANAALLKGYNEIIRFLLGQEVTIDVHMDHLRNTLQAALLDGHAGILKALNPAQYDNSDGQNSNQTPNSARSSNVTSLAEIPDNLRLPLQKDAKNLSTVYDASMDGYLEIVRLLLQKNIEELSRVYAKSLCIASEYGYLEIARLLLLKGTDANSREGMYGNALQTAAIKGHAELVRLFLKHATEVNEPGGWCGTALQGASYGGHQDIVRHLLESGADIESRTGVYGTSLYIASEKGHQQVIELLLDKGADVSAAGGHLGNAFHVASFECHEQILQLLLDNGADVNAPGGHLGNALHVASFKGHEQILQLLLDNGADVNAPGGHLGNALHVASFKGHKQIVQLLLDKGADINALARGDSALDVASDNGKAEVAELLLRRGANLNKRPLKTLYTATCYGNFGVVQLLLETGVYVNQNIGDGLRVAARAGHFQLVELLIEAEVNNQVELGRPHGHLDNALWNAADQGHADIVQLLLFHGVDVNARGVSNDTALTAAIAGRHIETVRLLIEKGANVNAESGIHGNPLQAASSGGHIETVRLLIEKGANVNAESDIHRNPLQAASYRGHIDIVRLLINKGANVNAEGGIHRNPLQAASIGGHIETVRLLIEKGANVNAESDIHGNPLTAAITGCHIETVRLLIDKGANVNAEGGIHGNPLTAALAEQEVEIAQLLIERGANVNAKGGKYGNPLQAASSGGHIDIVRLLINKGANVNAQGGRYRSPLGAAIAGRHREIRRLLIDEGANIVADYGSPPAAASAGCNFEIEGLLLESEGGVVDATGVGNTVSRTWNGDEDEFF